MNLAREADRFLRIDKHGHLENSELPDKTVLDDEDAITKGVDDGHIMSEVAVQKERLIQGKEKSSAAEMTDRMVYQTYFRSINNVNMAIFFACAIAFAFTINFPSQFSLISDCHVITLTKRSDIWVKWWSAASTSTSSESTGYWIGLYALFSVLPLLMVSLWVA